MNQAEYDLAKVHWKMHRTSVFPASLKGRKVEMQSQDAHTLGCQGSPGYPNRSEAVPKIYDCEVVAKQVTVSLSDVFERRRSARGSNEVCGFQRVLKHIVSVLGGDEWQYFWRLAETVRLVCIPDER